MAKIEQYKVGLETMARRAYEHAEREGKTLEKILLQPQYKELTDYWSFSQILQHIRRWNI